MRILFIGDIVGKPGRDIVCRAVTRLVAERKLDLVVANAENAAGGSGLTPAIYRELTKAGVDAITLGDHVYRRKEIYSTLEAETNIVKPANLPPESVGRDWVVVKARNGVPVAVACFLGRLFMKPVDSPWQAADRVLAALPSDVRVRLIDFHAEATSDMQLMGRYLDGRVTAVLGTHTHVPDGRRVHPAGRHRVSMRRGHDRPIRQHHRPANRPGDGNHSHRPANGIRRGYGRHAAVRVDRRGRSGNRPGRGHREAVCEGSRPVSRLRDPSRPIEYRTSSRNMPFLRAVRDNRFF